MAIGVSDTSANYVHFVLPVYVDWDENHPESEYKTITDSDWYEPSDAIDVKCDQHNRCCPCCPKRCHRQPYYPPYVPPSWYPYWYN